MELNQFSLTDKVQLLANDLFSFFTFERHAKPRAVIGFAMEDDDTAAGMFLIPMDFTPREGLHLRTEMIEAARERGIRTMWTASERNPIIARWHDFLGMRKQGVLLHDKISYDVWEMKLWAM